MYLRKVMSRSEDYCQHRSANWVFIRIDEKPGLAILRERTYVIREK